MMIFPICRDYFVQNYEKKRKKCCFPFFIITFAVQKSGNKVRILNCPAAVSSLLRCKHEVTDIVGKTLATGL